MKKGPTNKANWASNNGGEQKLIHAVQLLKGSFEKYGSHS